MPETRSKLRGETTSKMEEGFASIAMPFQQLIKDQKSASLLLLGSTVLALVIANSPLGNQYAMLLHTKVGLFFGDTDYSMSVRHWINDGLMALFFFTLGLEIKRELLVGEFREPARSIPVIAAAAGGMLVPALLYFALAREGDAIRGWAIPMATDTAFAIGILALLGRRVPKGLTAFVLALAIIDDMGAVAVIALFYTESIDMGYFGAALALLMSLAIVNLMGIRRPVVYFAGGALVWIAMLGSGVHATMAGILVALTVPARSARSPQKFVRRSRQLINKFESIEQEEDKAAPVLAEPQKHEVVKELQAMAAETTTPLQLWENALTHPVSLFVLPLFALANAGIELQVATLPTLLSQPIALGIISGLAIGKLLGITLATYLVLALGFGRLPEGMTRRHLPGLAQLAGIGFTMSIFIAGLAFAGQPDQLLAAKTGILAASLLAGLAGYLWLRVTLPEPGSG